MSIPSFTERQLVLAVVAGLAIAMAVVMSVPGLRRADDSTGAGDPPPAVTSHSSPALPGSSETPAPPDGSVPPAGPATGPTAPSTAPTGPPGAPPASASAQAPTVEPGAPTSGPGAAAGPTVGGDGAASPAPGAPPPAAPGPAQAPPPVVDELPAPVSAVHRLVAGFPQLLAPPSGSRVEVSGLSNDGVHAEVSLLARTTDPPTVIVEHYRDRLTGIGFDEPRTVEAGRESTARFARGPERVVVTASEGSFTLLASVVPDPAPLVTGGGGKGADSPGGPGQGNGGPGNGNGNGNGGQGNGKGLGREQVPGDDQPAPAPETTPTPTAPVPEPLPEPFPAPAPAGEAAGADPGGLWSGGLPRDGERVPVEPQHLAEQGDGAELAVDVELAQH